MSINNIDLLCNICGDDLENKFVYTTDCNHKFHYECLQKSFLKSLENSTEKRSKTFLSSLSSRRNNSIR